MSYTYVYRLSQTSCLLLNEEPSTKRLTKYEFQLNRIPIPLVNADGYGSDKAESIIIRWCWLDCQALQPLQTPEAIRGRCVYHLRCESGVRKTKIHALSIVLSGDVISVRHSRRLGKRRSISVSLCIRRCIPACGVCGVWLATSQRLMPLLSLTLINVKTTIPSRHVIRSKSNDILVV